MDQFFRGKLIAAFPFSSKNLRSEYIEERINMRKENIFQLKSHFKKVNNFKNIQEREIIFHETRMTIFRVKL
jgi:hypothetical protein